MDQFWNHQYFLYFGAYFGIYIIFQITITFLPFDMENNNFICILCMWPWPRDEDSGHGLLSVFEFNFERVRVDGIIWKFDTI